MYPLYFLQLCNSNENSVDVSIPIFKAVLESTGPFVTVRSVQSSFSGKKRPPAAAVNEVMQNPEADGFGKRKDVERTTAFFKCLPTRVTDETLQ